MDASQRHRRAQIQSMLRRSGVDDGVTNALGDIEELAPGWSTTDEQTVVDPDGNEWVVTVEVRRAEDPPTPTSD